MMATDTRYNGWTNYETWNVSLWIGNDQGSYNFWNEQAQECYDEAEASSYLTREEVATQDLSNRLKSEIKDNAPDLGASCYADLLDAAICEVNWHEIAAGMIEEVDKDEETEEDSDEE